MSAGKPVASPGGLPPGSWLGLLGGGQLGRMFCMAAQSLGYRVCVLDPGADSPAGSIAERHLQADYLDEAALDELAGLCKAVTTEFENVPAQALERLAARCIVSPRASSVAIAQDRIAEKSFLRDSAIPVAPWAAVLSDDDLRNVDPALLPGILKVARLGYDGKGQARVETIDEARAAFGKFGRVPCVLEQRLALELEVSAVVARGFDGRQACYPVSENLHVDGILAQSIAPARVSQLIASRAAELAGRIADSLDYVGVLCVEFFVLADDSLLVNEIAPRPHNSGHYTIDACVTSQFEQQVRVMAGLPLGSTHQHQCALMLNLLGDVWEAAGGEPPWSEVLAHPKARLHLYGKTQARRGRKMGHLTIVADSLAEASQVALDIERRLHMRR
ncbi:MAG: 5-(carboxyamino)imidazole ribonucleotide synthase [Limnobacter sp.]|nr:5-(carboxyamino)imidazole ribonucleotide synthase [Limnobacter sp.]